MRPLFIRTKTSRIRFGSGREFSSEKRGRALEDELARGYKLAGNSTVVWDDGELSIFYGNDGFEQRIVFNATQNRGRRKNFKLFIRKSRRQIVKSSRRLVGGRGG